MKIATLRRGRISWLLPAVVVALGIAVLGFQASSSAPANNLPTLPVSPVNGIANTSVAGTDSTDSEVISLRDWRDTAAAKKTSGGSRSKR